MIFAPIGFEGLDFFQLNTAREMGAKLAFKGAARFVRIWVARQIRFSARLFVNRYQVIKAPALHTVSPFDVANYTGFIALGK